MINIRIAGLPRTIRTFKKVAKKSPLVAYEIVKEGSKRLKTYAQTFVDERTGKYQKTGKLRRSIRRRSIYQPDMPYAIVWAGEGLTKDYSNVIEFGSKPHYIWNNPIWAIIHKTQKRPHPRTKPVRFFRSATNKTAREMKKIIEESWNKHFRVI